MVIHFRFAALLVVIICIAGWAHSTGLTWAPSTPEIGEVAVFTITDHTVPVRAEWDFGANGCLDSPRYLDCEPGFSNCDQMAFSFSSGGEKTVSVTVYDPISSLVLGSATRNVTVEATGFCQAIDDEIFVLQSSNAAGISNSLFHHGMSVFNPLRLETSFQIDWLPIHAENSSTPATAMVAVPGESVVSFDNVLQDILAVNPNVIGALRIREQSDSLEFSSRSIHTSDEGERGWTISTVRRSDGFSAGDEGFIIGLGEDAEVRSNIYCVNFTASPTRVHAELRNSAGVHLETIEMDLAPLSYAGINRIFIDHEPVEGYVRLSTDLQEGEFSCAGWVLTNFGDDSRTEFVHDATGFETVNYLPRAIHGIDSVSDLVLFAPAGDATARIDLLPTGQDNTSYASVHRFVPDQEELRLDDVLSSLFGYSGTAALRVVVTSGRLVVSASETTSLPSGNLHRLARFRPLAEQTSSGGHAAIIQLKENTGYRTDIGVVNTSGFAIEVLVDLRDAVGSYLGARRLEVLPFSHMEIQGVFAAIGHPVVSDGVARISTSTPGGSFLAYAVLRELNTLDSWEMASFPVVAPPFADDFEFGDTSMWAFTTP